MFCRKTYLKWIVCTFDKVTLKLGCRLLTYLRYAAAEQSVTTVECVQCATIMLYFLWLYFDIILFVGMLIVFKLLSFDCYYRYLCFFFTAFSLWMLLFPHLLFIMQQTGIFSWLPLLSGNTPKILTSTIPRIEPYLYIERGRNSRHHFWSGMHVSLLAMTNFLSVELAFLCQWNILIDSYIYQIWFKV